MRNVRSFRFLIGGLALVAGPVLAQAEEKNPYDFRSTVPHEAQVFDHGIVSLEKRLQMIASAKKSIDVEYFIYNTDQSGRLFTQALIEKKRRDPGVEVRVLVDASGTVLQLSEFHVAELKRHGVEVRYYNPVGMARIVTTQYRNHRKALIIDGEEVLTGGRNLGDEYYDLHKEFNFLDRDLWVKGPAAGAVKETFDAYWNDPHVRAPKAPAKPDRILYGEYDDPNANSNYERDVRDYEDRLAAAADFVKPNATDRWFRSEIASLSAGRAEEGKGVCQEVHFLTDRPGFSWGRNAHSDKRVVRDGLIKRTSEAKKGDELFVESPYLILKREGKDAFKRVANRCAPATILTNSLASTDAFYVASVFNTRAAFYKINDYIRLFAHSGRPMPETLWAKDPKGKPVAGKANWGIHAKSTVFDSQGFAVGTFNLDPRSANLNTEMLMLCEKSPELAAYMTARTKARLALSYELGRDGTPIEKGVTLFSGSSPSKTIMFMLSILPASLLDFLL